MADETPSVGDGLMAVVCYHFYRKHWAPSEIDKKYRLPEGMAHDMIVRSWADIAGTIQLMAGLENA